MKIHVKKDGIHYMLCNEDIQLNDEVFPISHGLNILDEYYHEAFNFADGCSGFPNNPHIIKNLNYDNGRQGKTYQVHTDHGWGSKEKYYKIIAKVKDKKNFSTFLKEISIKLKK